MPIDRRTPLPAPVEEAMAVALRPTAGRSALGYDTAVPPPLFQATAPGCPTTIPAVHADRATSTLLHRAARQTFPMPAVDHGVEQRRPPAFRTAFSGDPIGAPAPALPFHRQPRTSTAPGRITDAAPPVLPFVAFGPRPLLPVPRPLKERREAEERRVRDSRRYEKRRPPRQFEAHATRYAAREARLFEAETARREKRKALQERRVAFRGARADVELAERDGRRAVVRAARSAAADLADVAEVSRLALVAAERHAKQLREEAQRAALAEQRDAAVWEAMLKRHAAVRAKAERLVEAHRLKIQRHEQSLRNALRTMESEGAARARRREGMRRQLETEAEETRTATVPRAVRSTPSEPTPATPPLRTQTTPIKAVPATLPLPGAASGSSTPRSVGSPRSGAESLATVPEGATPRSYQTPTIPRSHPRSPTSHPSTPPSEHGPAKPASPSVVASDAIPAESPGLDEAELSADGWSDASWSAVPELEPEPVRPLRLSHAAVRVPLGEAVWPLGAVHAIPGEGVVCSGALHLIAGAAALPSVAVLGALVADAVPLFLGTAALDVSIAGGHPADDARGESARSFVDPTVADVTVALHQVRVHLSLFDAGPRTLTLRLSGPSGAVVAALGLDPVVPLLRLHPEADATQTSAGPWAPVPPQSVLVQRTPGSGLDRCRVVVVAAAFPLDRWSFADGVAWTDNTLVLDGVPVGTAAADGWSITLDVDLGPASRLRRGPSSWRVVTRLLEALRRSGGHPLAPHRPSDVPVTVTVRCAGGATGAVALTVPIVPGAPLFFSACASQWRRVRASVASPARVLPGFGFQLHAPLLPGTAVAFESAGDSFDIRGGGLAVTADGFLFSQVHKGRIAALATAPGRLTLTVLSHLSSLEGAAVLRAVAFSSATGAAPEALGRRTVGVCMATEGGEQRAELPLEVLPPVVAAGDAVVECPPGSSVAVADTLVLRHRGTADDGPYVVECRTVAGTTEVRFSLEGHLAAGATLRDGPGSLTVRWPKGADLGDLLQAARVSPLSKGVAHCRITVVDAGAGHSAETVDFDLLATTDPATLLPFPTVSYRHGTVAASRFLLCPEARVLLPRSVRVVGCDVAVDLSAGGFGDGSDLLEWLPAVGAGAEVELRDRVLYRGERRLGTAEVGKASVAAQLSNPAGLRAEDVTAALRSIAYRHADSRVRAGQRLFTVRLAFSVGVTQRFRVGVGVAPVLCSVPSFAAKVTVTCGAALPAVCPKLLINAAPEASVAVAAVEVRITRGATAEDAVGLPALAPPLALQSGRLHVAGADVGAVEQQPGSLRVVLAAPLSAGVLQALLRSVGYTNAGTVQSPQTRVVDFLVVEQDGSHSAAAVSIHVHVPDTPAQLTAPSTVPVRVDTATPGAYVVAPEMAVSAATLGDAPALRAEFLQQIQPWDALCIHPGGPDGLAVAETVVSLRGREVAALQRRKGEGSALALTFGADVALADVTAVMRRVAYRFVAANAPEPQRRQHLRAWQQQVSKKVQLSFRSRAQLWSRVTASLVLS